MTEQNSHGQWNKTFVQVHAQKSVTPIDVCYLLVHLTDVVKSVVKLLLMVLQEVEDIRCQDCLHMEPLETQATQVVNVKSC